MMLNLGSSILHHIAMLMFHLLKISFRVLFSFVHPSCAVARIKGSGVSTTYFHIFRKFGQISPKKFANSLKSSKIGITPVKTTEILRNSEKNRRKFDENLQNLRSLSKINKNFAEICKNSAKVVDVCTSIKISSFIASSAFACIEHGIS